MIRASCLVCFDFLVHFLKVLSTSLLLISLCLDSFALLSFLWCFWLYEKSSPNHSTSKIIIFSYWVSSTQQSTSLSPGNNILAITYCQVQRFTTCSCVGFTNTLQGVIPDSCVILCRAKSPCLRLSSFKGEKKKKEKKKSLLSLSRYRIILANTRSCCTEQLIDFFFLFPLKNHYLTRISLAHGHMKIAPLFNVEVWVASYTWIYLYSSCFF